MDKQRTLKQNQALHLFFTYIADELTTHGLDMRKTLKPTVEIPWSGKSVKEYIWRPVMKAQLGKSSTTEMTTKEIDQVLDTLTKHFGEKFGITLTFPSVESLINEQRRQND
jgi:hypothetical protein